MTAAFDSAYYPYEKVQSGFNTLKGAENIPLKLLTYLLDLPDKNGYVPKDDNSRARVRFSKYIWHDGANPLGKPLPTPKEKLSMLFDGDKPVVNTDEEKELHPKGYRLYWQQFWGQTQLTAQTTLKCYIGRIIPTTPFKTVIGIVFEIFVNVNQENNMRTDAYARAFAIEQCLIEALHGVNITGVGVCDFHRSAHIDNGSQTIADQGTHVGRLVKMSIDWMESDERQSN